ncbi:MAG: MarR family transcriptional regulator, partial [Eubacteriales bacterium]|nr:MarR family transcriptional regulator [Eubacteriales bacterium]
MKNDTLIGAFFAVGGMNRRRARVYFNAVDISPGQPRILRYLDSHDGCIQRDLAVHCHLEPASVTSVLGTMENKGYIVRTPVENDKRAQRVWLTEKGRE